MYDVILADPPWQYKVFNEVAGKAGKAVGAAHAHYNTMTVAQMKTLPMDKLTNPNAALFMWATNPCLPEAFDLMKAWGFQYKTIGFTWVKVYQNGNPYCGLGHYTRSAVEMCLLGIRGRMSRADNKVLQVIQQEAPVIHVPRQGHSRKPDEQYELIERLFGGDRKRLELFARRPWDGWSAWGNQIESTPEVAATIEGGEPDDCRL